MNISFSFNEQQAAAFESFLEAGVQSLQEQQAVLLSHIEKELISVQNTGLVNMQNYLNTVVVPQLIVIGDILESIQEAKKPKLHI